MKQSSASDDETKRSSTRHNPTASLPTHLIPNPKSQDRRVKFEDSKFTDKISTENGLSLDIFVTPTNSPLPSPPPSPTTHPHTPTPSQLHTISDRAFANQDQRPLFKDIKLNRSKERQYDTFFSRPECKFGDIVLLKDDHIPSKEFLDSATVLLPFFGESIQV